MVEKVALVTGAVAGIGASCARRLASMNMAISVLDLDLERCAATAASTEEAGGRALARGADIADRTQVVEAGTWGGSSPTCQTREGKRSLRRPAFTRRPSERVRALSKLKRIEHA